MKTTLLAISVAVLLISVTNLLFNLGILGASANEYQALSSSEMDKIGFKALAQEHGITIDDSGTQPKAVADTEIRVSFRDASSKQIVIDFPSGFAMDLAKTKLLPFTISSVEKQGWKFVSVSSDNHYIFQKR